ncbi:hypothetical protein C2E23DRAFT_576495 [Lenzites betulinus]|nr:hypothetical protein C2E23DRAFT_576495 [Lenzites betulinus]
MGVSEPLLYVHWFRRFRTPDHVTGLHPTSRSTRAHKCHVTIVRMNDLVRPCHLIHKFGHTTVDPRWLMEDVLDEPITFLYNRYLDLHSFESRPAAMSCRAYKVRRPYVPAGQPQDVPCTCPSALRAALRVGTLGKAVREKSHMVLHVIGTKP